MFHINIDDVVEVHQVTGKRKIGTNERDKEGTIVAIGRKFAVVDFGQYRESYFFNELRLIKSASGADNLDNVESESEIKLA